MREIKFKDLKKEYQNLLNKAEKALKNSYSPYSNLLVGAALLTKNNKIITGSNVENASYRLTICAEQAVVARANALGERCFTTIAIIAKTKNGTGNRNIIFAPCGACRQILFEFSKISGIDLEIIMSSADKKKVLIAKISELLPLAFTL